MKITRFQLIFEHYLNFSFHVNPAHLFASARLGHGPCREAQRYLYKNDHYQKLHTCREIENFEKRGRSLLVVVATPPTENYEEFTEKVREYNTKEPFNFTVPPFFNNLPKTYNKVSFDQKWKQFNFEKKKTKFNFVRFSSQFVSIYAAYLYDSVKLYAWALDKLLKEEERPLTENVIRDIASNGTRLIETIIKNRTYKSKTAFK